MPATCSAPLPGLPLAEGMSPATQAPPAASTSALALAPPLAAVTGAVLLAACGGGGGSASAGTAAGSSSTPPAAAAPSAQEAARFLHQAALASSSSDLLAVQTQGLAGWLTTQLAAPTGTALYDWLVAQGYNVSTNQFSQAGMDAALWQALATTPNPLAHRMALFWLEFFVVSINGLPVAWPQFVAVAYYDLLVANGRGNFRDLLKAVTLSTAMGEYLSLRGSTKADAAGIRHPDENYAREVMQLFTLGLYALNADGSTVLVNGQPVPTYTQDDVMGLAAAFTGWEFAAASTSPDYARLPMVQIASRHATTASTFLGVTVPAGTTGTQTLEIILDTLFHHPNVPPFVGRQMIQRLVTSNPSAAYVARVSAVFTDDGHGVRGNLSAVIQAVLLDAEARQPASPSAGRVREPMLRLVQWMRTFNASSKAGTWPIGDTSDAATRLGQSPLRAPTVFNFFSPGYTPPGSALAAQGLAAPELQLLDESTVAGYLNYMQRAIGSGIGGDVLADYTELLALAGDAAALVDRTQLLLAAGQLDTASLGTIQTAVSSISAATAAGLSARVQASVLLVMASPAYQVLK